MRRNTALVVTLAIFLGLFWMLGYSTGVEAKRDLSKAVRSDEETRIIETYKRVNEAVVFISTLARPDPFDFLPELQAREGSGSGLIVNAEKGIILTNLHVIQDAAKVEIFLSDGRNYPARLLGHDAEYDLAVLQLVEAPKKLVALSFGDSNQLEIGQRVLAIGNPHGLDRTLTQGIVSSLNRTVRNPNDYLMRGLIQTDAAINPGNSGGPLLDVDGRVIGVTTAILSRSGDSAGIGFAVPINQIARILPELITTGRVLRPKLGWVLLDTAQGPMVRRVLPGSPAESVGIEPIERPVANIFYKGFVSDFSRADIVYKVNGTRVFSSDDVDHLVSRAKRGKRVELTLRRGSLRGVEREVEVVPVLQ